MHRPMTYPPRDLPLRSDRPLVLAHRGASADAPENTLAAFTEAVAENADGVELDVMVCGTGEVVVCHDDTLVRLAGLDVRIDQTPLERLRSIDVGSRFDPGFRGERIPLLSEVLATLPEGMMINVELKSERANDHGLARKTAALLASDSGRHPIVVSSFSPLELARTRVYAPRARTGLLFEPESRLLLRHGTLAYAVANTSVHPEHTQCTLASVRRWHERGYAVFTWTVDEAEEIGRLCRAGVDAIITNRPRSTLLAIQALQSAVVARSSRS
jgi:glycerophosphoryl diester phosphodiesterase